MRYDAMLAQRVLDALFRQPQHEPAADDDPQVSGFDWSILVEPILEVIISLLSGCPMRSQPISLVQSFREPNWLQRIAIRMRLRRHPDIPRECCDRAYDAVLTVMAETKPAELVGLLSEMDETLSDWRPWT